MANHIYSISYLICFKDTKLRRDHRICIKFCVKKCSKTIEILTAAYGEAALTKKIFISGISSSKMTEKILMTTLALDIPVRQQQMKVLK